MLPGLSSVSRRPRCRVNLDFLFVLPAPCHGSASQTRGVRDGAAEERAQGAAGEGQRGQGRPLSGRDGRGPRGEPPAGACTSTAERRAWGAGHSCQGQVLTDGLGVGAGRSSGVTSFLAWRPYLWNLLPPWRGWGWSRPALGRELVIRLKKLFR